MATHRVSRRRFLKVTIVPITGATVASMLGCTAGAGGPQDSLDGPSTGATGADSETATGGETDTSGATESPDEVFPQGLASGDPRPESIILWTRVEPATVAGEPEVVGFEVAHDDQFQEVIAQGEVTAELDSDHTVRVKPVGLSPYTTYYYRFFARGVLSPVGRTKTAPLPDQDVAVRFAVASCQDYIARYYHAWKVLADDEGPVDFVLFLGDYIYEAVDDPRFQMPSDDRKVELPDGLPLGDPTTPHLAALTLADYRALYRTYRTDPELRRVHQLYPFITVWDDHEFTNDCWQDRANEFDGARGDEQDTARRTAATRAWFEHMPVDLEYQPDRGFPEDIRIYRALRYGRHVELFLNDQRYYRSDHVVPEGPVDLSVGKFRENSSLGARVLALKAGFDLREAEVRPTMLGESQRMWLIDSIRSSTATWKVWANQVQLAQLLFDLRNEQGIPGLFQNQFYFKPDLWDGYRSERADILTRLADIPNVVSLAGDIHAFYASEIWPDPDDLSGDPTAVEYIVTGISSIHLKAQLELAVETDETLANGGLAALLPRVDEIILASNPAYRYARSDAYGFAMVEVDGAKEMRVSYFEIADVQSREFDGNLATRRFRTVAGTNRIEQV